MRPADTRPTLRQEQAAVTRRRILDAARALFFRNGYAATTLKAVAEEAGVAVQTLYAVFGSKAAILAELRQQVVAQPEASSALADAMQAPTLDDRVTAFAHSIRERWELAGDIVRVNEDAARADPAIRADTKGAAQRRQAGIARFVHGAAEDLGLDLDLTHTTAIVDALTMYDLYEQLVGVHGWSSDAYETWLTDQLRYNLRQP
jgi:AcrR family transcriptional regulator